MALTYLEKTLHSAVERTLSIFSPSSALRRNEARKLFELAYDAASPGRSRGTPNISTTKSSESIKNQADRVKMMWDARDLAQNYSFVKSVLYKESMYVCGTIKYQANTGNPELDAAVEDYWGWFEENCDITGRHVLGHLIQIAHMSMRRDGDFGLILVDGEQGELKLQAVEADRIGNPSIIGQEPNYFGGIKVNDVGAVEFYRIYDRTIHGQYLNPTEIDPGSFIHYFDPMRADQYRGITAFDTVIPHARDMYELLQMEKQAVKWGASHAGVIMRTDPAVPAWAGDPGQATTDNGTSKEKCEPGTILRLQAGESVQMFQTASRPSPTFNGFIEAIIREMANGLVLPFSFVWDMAALGGVSARIELAMAQRTFERAQKLLTHQVLNKIKTAALQRGVALGILPADPNLYKGDWQFPAYITADEGYSSQADIAELQMGLKTRHQIFSERGQDFEEQTEMLAKEVAHYQMTAMKHMVPIELMTQSLPMATQMLAMMQAAQGATEAGQEAPGPVEEEGGGETTSSESSE